MLINGTQDNALAAEIVKNANSDISLSPEETSQSGISTPNMDNSGQNNPIGIDDTEEFPGQAEALDTVKQVGRRTEASFKEIMQSSFAVAYHRTNEGYRTAIEAQVRKDLDSIKDNTPENMKLGFAAQEALERLKNDSDLSAEEKLFNQGLVQQWNSKFADAKGARRAEDIYLANNERLKQEHIKAADDYERTSGAGAWIAQLTGGMLGNLQDPANMLLNTVTLPFGGVGATAVKRVLSAGGILGTIGAALNLTDYKAIRRSNEAINQDTSVVDVATEGFVGGAVLGAGFQGTGEIIGAVADSVFKRLSPINKEGATQLGNNAAMMVAKARQAQADGIKFSPEVNSAIDDAEGLLEIMKLRPKGVSEAEWLSQVQQETQKATTLSDDWSAGQKELPTETDLNVSIEGESPNQWQRNLEEDLNQQSGLLQDLNPLAKKLNPEQRAVQQQIDNVFNIQTPQYQQSFKYRFGASMQNLIYARQQRAIALMPSISKAFNEVSPAARKILQEDFLKAIKGEPSSPEGIKLANDFQNSIGELHSELNRYGIKIESLDKWSPRPGLKPNKLQEIGKEKFIKAGKATLELKNKETGKPLTDTELDTLLSKTYDKVLLTPKSTKILATRDYERKFTFKSASHEIEFYSTVTDDFDLYQAILNYTADAAKNIEMARQFGPEWQNTLPKLFEKLRQDAVRVGLIKAESDITRTVIPGVPVYGDINLMMLYKTVTDNLDPASSQAVRETLSTAMALYRASALGSSFYANIADLGQAAVRKSELGLKGNLWKDFAANFTWKHKFTENELAQKGILAEQVLRENGIAFRADLNDNASGTAAKIGQGVSEFVFKVGLLTRLNKSLIRTGQSELLFTIADQIRLNKYTPEIKDLLDRYGFTASDIAELNKSIYTEGKEFHYFELKDLENSDVQLKLTAAVAEEMKRFSLMPPAEVQAVINRGGELGTAHGTIGRNVFFAKSFLITQFLYQTRYALSRELPVGAGKGVSGLAKAMPKIKYAVKALTYMTLMGGLVTQIQELRRGKDFLDPTGPTFWAKALNQGVGLGVFGDITLRTQPFQAKDVLNYGGLLGQVGLQVGMMLAGEKKAKALYDLLNAFNPARNLLPLGPYAQKLFMDMPKYWFNKNPEADFRARRTRLKNDTGQGQWWESEEWLPDRLPKVAKEPKKKD